MPAADAPDPSPADAGARRLSWKHVLLVVVFSTSLLTIGLGRRALTWHEVAAAYPAKEMLRYGHWIVPQFIGIPRTAKPPATAWLIAASMKLFSNDAEWVARLPAALAGILTCLVIAHFAAIHFGPLIGVLAGLIQASCVYTIMQARLAEADMILCAAVTVALIALGRATIEPPERSAPRTTWPFALLFHVATGVAFLVKGPIGPIFVLLTALSFALIRREKRTWTVLFHPAGRVILIALLAAWPLAAYRQHPAILDAWRAELSPAARVQRHGGDGTTLFLYFYEAPVLLLPWLPVIAVGVWQGFKRDWHRRPLGQFFLCWFIPGFLVLTLIPFRHKHYILPLLPPFSIVGACALDGLFPRTRSRATGTLIAIFLVTWLLELLVVIWIIPRQEGYRFAAELAQRAAAHVPPDQTIWLIDATPGKEPYAAYYLRPPMARRQTLQSLLDDAPADRPIYVLAKREHLDALNNIRTVEVLDQAKELRRRESESERLVLFRITRT